MLKKLKLKRQIKACQKEIDFLEKKRARSQAALVEALLTHAEPDDRDVDYFNGYTARINETRTHKQKLESELKSK